jgi:trehalose/maltose hydrolase-like predicted phosphorylase
MIGNESKQTSWLIVEREFLPENALLNETLFSLGNGYLGMRGNFEEGMGHSSMEGTYINGFYESAPIVYGEKLFGFAEEKQTMLNLANAKVIRLTVGDEPFDMLSGRLLSYQRVLKMREGLLHRSLQWESPRGKQIMLEVDRLVLQTHRHIALIRYRVTPLNFDGPLTLFSGIDGAISQSEHAEGDPRLGTQFSEEVLKLQAQTFAGGTTLMVHQTARTQFTVACGIRNILDTACITEKTNENKTIGFTYRFEAQNGVPITLAKMIAYATSLDSPASQVVATVSSELDIAVERGFEALYAEQRSYMVAFWDTADITIEGDEAAQRGIRFNMFHLLQSAGRDGRTNIAAKGLTGLGYEGHYFWDSEIYALPFFLYSHPEISRKLLEYRYSILDKARQWARHLAHRSGALYPWRTINGAECSANFPTGTAQYHINADIAFAIQRYFDATQDADFMKRYGAEILSETARLWLDTGDFIPSKDDQFCINGVTGPDEYQIIVNNNAFTNLMARQNLRFAHEIINWLRETDRAAYNELITRIELHEDEPVLWQRAADRMYIPYDDEMGIIPQDDSFIYKAAWDFANTPPEHHPLLLHYHPLMITRYQVCKQADLVLAEFLLHDQFDRAQKKRDFDFYEPITTHDSSLSACIFGMMAAELGDVEKAHRYFTATAFTDLENKHGNTQAGIHVANMAGAWQSIVFGFAGMRAKNGLSFNPAIPAQWQAYAFKVRYRGRLIHVRVTHLGEDFKLLEGEPLVIQVGDTTFRLEV